LTPIALSLTVLTPIAALAGLAIVVPLATIVVVTHRRRVLHRSLGFPTDRWLVRLREAAALYALFGLLIVRFWNERERVYAPGGVPERYRLDLSSMALRASLSENPGVSTYGADDPEQLLAAAESYLDPGPIVAARASAFAPWLALAAALPLALVLVWRPR
jgi:hypothetical protein